MEKFGVKKKNHVYVGLEQFGMEIFVLSNKNVMEAWNGTKILGHVNVLQLQCTMGLIVLQIHVMVDKFGIIFLENAFALEGEFFKIMCVSLLKLLVLMGEYGIVKSLFVNAQMDYGTMELIVSLSQIVNQIKFIPL